MNKINISLNPNEANIIGVVKNNLFIRINEPDYNFDDNNKCTEIIPEEGYETVVIKISKKKFFDLYNKWIDTKRKYCESGYFCGIFGDISVEEYKIIGEITKGGPCNPDGFYPLIKVTKWSEYCDMEHG